MIKRLVLALPFAFAAAMLARVTGTIAVATLVFLVLAVSVFVPARWAPGPLGHRAMSAVVPAVGLALGAALAMHAPGPSRVTETWAAVGAAALLLASTRLLVKHAPLGYKATAALGVLSMVACGQTRTGGVYPAAAAAFVVSVLAAMRLDDDARGETTRRAKVAAVIVGVAASAITAALLLVLPRTHDWVQSKFDLLYSGYARSGFSERLHLGQMRHMLQSDEIVFRVRGPRPDYLRGVVFDFYYYGVWGVESKDDPHAVETQKGAPEPSARATLVQRVSGANDRLFVPYDARDVSTPRGWARADDRGVYFRAPDDNGELVWFVKGARDAVAPVGPPTRLDTKMVTSPGEERHIRELAFAWTAGAEDDLAKLAAIERHLLQEYTYSLSYERDGPDPVVDFLFTHKEGHCEYFASAMALLARSLGIPARVVGGYRVAERSPIGSYWIVRERNAHTWVEAWAKGPDGAAWTSFDPTPMSELPDDQPHDGAFFAGLADAVRVFRDDALAWIARRTPGELVIAAGSLTALFAAVRWLRIRRRRAERARADGETEQALACLEPFLSALAAKGAARAPDEPLERFAARLADREAAALLEKYAAFRYGGIGVRASLERDMSAYARGKGG